MMNNPTIRTLGRDDWMTPDEVFRPLHAVFDFTGDACATDRDAARLPRFLSPEEDALATPWNRIGPRVWLNPPYGRQIGDWFARSVDQCSKGTVDSVVMLTFANTDTVYWRDFVASSEHCHAVMFLRPRVRFVRPDGVPAGGAPKGSALIVYSARPRWMRWPFHCYADWSSPGWVERSGLADLAAVVAGRIR
jgi:phage N-6-adenine-methyltransferase